MIRGTFTTTDRGYTGEIRSFGVREQVELRRVEGKDNDKAPDFRIHPADDDRIDYGAAWAKISKENRPYVSFKLTLLGGTPVYLRLFENETTPGIYELVSDCPAAPRPTWAGRSFSDRPKGARRCTAIPPHLRFLSSDRTSPAVTARAPPYGRGGIAARSTVGASDGKATPTPFRPRTLN